MAETSTLPELADATPAQDGPTGEIHPRSWLATATHAELQQRILDDATHRREVQEDYRRMLRERDDALGIRDHALDLAAQYARQAGVDLSTDAALRYAEQWRDRLDGWGRTAQEQESRRLGNLGVMMQLQDLAAGKRTFAGTVAELATVVAKALSNVNSAQHGPKKIRDLFVAPDVPQLLEADRG